MTDKDQRGFIMSNETLDKLVELSMLYDFYGALLNEHKRHVFEDYILNDLSLSEIAKEEGISRQGVHDLIKRCSKELYDYEEKLALMEKFRKTKGKVEQIRQIANEIKETNILQELEPIERIVLLSNEMLEDS